MFVRPLALLCAPVLLAQTTLHVAPRGDDAANGGAGAPFRTLERARDAARQSARPVTIVVQAGVYNRQRALELGPADSNVEWRAEGAVSVSGGVVLPAGCFTAASNARLKPEARGKVVVCDVGKLGVARLGALTPRGFGRPRTPAHSEVFWNGKRMTLARWPNDRFARIAAPADPAPVDDDHGRRHGRLEYGFRTGEQPGAWASVEDVWVHGYWSWDWANSYEAVESFDRATGVVRTRAPHGQYGFRTGQRFFFLNVLEELDSPGEYYVDRKAGQVYVWPPAEVRGASISMSVLDEPLVKVAGARNLTLAGFSFETARGNAIEIAGGSNVRVENCLIRNTGNVAVTVEGGDHHAVSGCEVAQTGDGGIFLSGGDRRTLTAAGHEATDNHIHHIAEWTRTYQPGIRLEGVSLRAAHNLIHDGPHNAILMTGNDHMIEFNEIHRVCLETGDVGAFYLGRDWTERGVVVRHNYFHDTGGVGMGSMGIYLDDCASGVTVVGNIFERVPRAVFIGGGRDHLVDGNIFIDCDPAIHVDARGLDTRTVWRDMVQKTMRERLFAMNYLEAPYARRYPGLINLKPYYDSGEGIPPEGNIVVNNICVRGRWMDIRKNAETTSIEIGNNLVGGEELYAMPGYRPGAEARRAGIKAIPFERIGPRVRRRQ